MRFGLDRMRRLMTALDVPHERFASVHVVGTNGKSSTARMIAAVLQRQGMSTGAYLSPHLTTFAERVEIEGVAVSPERFAAAIQRAAQAAVLVDRTLSEGDRVTQFEALTAAAYWELARSGVRAAVFTIETPGGSYRGIELRALGRFQRTNFAAAVAAAEAFMGGMLDEGAVRRAARELLLPGRLEVVSERPLVVLDGAHNPGGARALAESLPDVVGRRGVVAVVSILDDKDAAGILSAILPYCKAALFTRSSRRGSLPPAVLESLWRQLGGPAGQVVADPAEAVAIARSQAGPEGAVLVTGSIYLLSDLVGGPALEIAR
jgi:folylpolyglutamate synthase/dihydropteroate synthase